MTGKTIPVDVEWAFQGKMLDRAGPRVLVCSNGNLSRENFTELIGRFSLGTADKLPQVSMSFATSGDGPGRLYYLGMAIQKWAADVKTDGGELLKADDDNRPVAVTTYFCVPYRPLADAAVPYQAMYQEFDNIRLDTADAPPLKVEFPLRSRPPVIDALAMQSASRLLTGRPVCVLGAESATMAERLEFIDAVAALLPYGFRTRLTAATWVRPTHRDHRFRLFFSDVARDANPPDHVVHWENPERTALTPHDDYAYSYDRWLADTVGQLGALARLTTPRAFNREEVFESLDKIGTPRLEPDEREPGEREPDEPGSRTRASRLMLRSARFDVDQLLRHCARSMQAQQLADLNTAIVRLRGLARSRIGPKERDRYRKFIEEQRLFRHDEALATLEAKLREALLKVAFTPPLTYPDYCLIEDSAGGEPPDQALLRLIEDTGMSETDVRIRAVVYAQLHEREISRWLQNWYVSAQLTAPQMINVVAGQWHRPRHAFYASVITADLMNRMMCDPALVRKELQQHSYLLRAVGDGGDNRQVHVLTTFLKTAYPNGLSEGGIRQVLMENAEPPSQALLAAVLLHLARPEDAQLAQQAYAVRTTLAMNLLPGILDALRERLAGADGQPSDPAPS